MVLGAPIRGSRKVYKINLITTNVDDAQNVIDNLPAGTETSTTRPIYVKIKTPIGEWLGLTPLAYDDPVYTGIFGGGGLNSGSKYRARIGGFRQASYTLIADGLFTVNEQVVNQETGVVARPLKYLKTMTIGFPKGHSVNELIAWLGTTGKIGEIKGIRGPSGAYNDLSTQIVNP